jgi:hypothetical protein
MDNVQNCDSYINIPSSQNYVLFTLILPEIRDINSPLQPCISQRTHCSHSAAHAVEFLCTQKLFVVEL